MPNTRATHRANMLTARLWPLVDPCHKASYGDLVEVKIAAEDDGTIVAGATFTDGSVIDWKFAPKSGAFAMRDAITADVDRRCAEIRKARHEAGLDEARHRSEHGV